MRIVFQFVEILVVLTVFIYVVRLIWENNGKVKNVEKAQNKRQEPLEVADAEGNLSSSKEENIK